MGTFGKFFEKLRDRIQRTGRTDSQCGDMDRYKSKRRTERAIPWGREDRGWKAIADQELSHSNLLEFSTEMTREGVRRLADRANSDRFDPDIFSWDLNSVHEFHHAMMEEARGCGLAVDSLPGWSEAREKKKQQKSTQG